MHGEDWFHVSRYDDFGIQSARTCSERAHDGAGGTAHFVQEETAKVAKASVEPHYREVEHETWDYDHVNEDTGLPEPILRTFVQPVVCTCANTSCSGWGKPMPDNIRKFREQEDALALERKRRAGST